jgi:hypothetical protein
MRRMDTEDQLSLLIIRLCTCGSRRGRIKDRSRTKLPTAPDFFKRAERGTANAKIVSNDRRKLAPVFALEFELRREQGWEGAVGLSLENRVHRLFFRHGRRFGLRKNNRRQRYDIRKRKSLPRINWGWFRQTNDMFSSPFDSLVELNEMVMIGTCGRLSSPFSAHPAAY